MFYIEQGRLSFRLYLYLIMRKAGFSAVVQFLQTYTDDY